MGGVLRRPSACILGVLVLSVMIVATPAGRRPFWSSDEARFALLAQDALDHGRWLVAELRGQHRSEEHTSELQSLAYLVCRLLLEKKKIKIKCLRKANTDGTRHRSRVTH